MPRRHPATQPVYAMRQYLEREFPGQVRHTGWASDSQSHVFEGLGGRGRLRVQP
jgi:hypothetical protein